MRVPLFILAASAALLCSCSGDESGTSCASIGPNTNYAVTLGGVDNLEAAADRDLGSFATFTAQGAGSYISSKGNQFAGGSNAGVFVTMPSDSTAADITVSTFAGQEQAIVESATGPTLTITPTHGGAATEYVSFTTTAPFNGVRLTVNTPNDAPFYVFEICGAAAVR